MFITGSVLAAAAIASAWVLLDPLGLPISGKTVTAVSASAPQASGPVASCPVTPATVAAGSQDGRFPFQPDVPGLTATDMASFIVMGKDAAASSHPRDAEVAFLMSCRLADKLKGANSVESADGKYLLGGHYAQLAIGAANAPDASRPELLRRAEFLYVDSLRIYSAAYGQADARTRSAADGLAAVRQTMAQAPTSPIAPPVSAPEKPVQVQAGALASLGVQGSPSSSPVPVASPPVRKVEVAKATLPASEAPQDQPPGMRSDASFDCSRARSTPEKMICSDAQLFQLNHEVGRVYARARDAAPDRAAFRRQNDLEASRRESICRDRGCLLRWYAYRRDQLMREIEGHTPLRPMTWR